VLVENVVNKQKSAWMLAHSRMSFKVVLPGLANLSVKNFIN